MLTLSAQEVVFLTDSIHNDDCAQGLPDSEAYVPLARALLLVLGSAYCELVSEAAIAEGVATISITEEQAWLLRSKVRTGDLGIDRTSRIGLTLLPKLYELLLRFNSFDTGLPPADEPPLPWDYFAKLAALKEETNAPTNTVADASSHESANYYSGDGA